MISKFFGDVSHRVVRNRDFEAKFHNTRAVAPFFGLGQESDEYLEGCVRVR